MNKKLLALAVAAASVSTAASAATIYQDDTSTLNMGGRVEVRANFSDANKSVDANGVRDGKDDNIYEDKSRVRFNLGGEQKLNNDISFIGFAEWEITENSDPEGDDAQINTRYMYGGVQSQKFGGLTYGHQDNAFTYLTNFTDNAEVFSGYINENNVATADRANNVLRYAFSTERLTIQASAQADSDSDGSTLTQNADGFGVIGAYKLTDTLEVGLGYAQTDANNAGDDRISTGDNNTYTVAARYTSNGVLLAATYEGGKVARSSTDESDFDAADAYLGYTFDDNNVNMTYNYFNADKTSFNEYNVNNIALEYARYFGNATVYGAYAFNLLSDGDAATNNQTEDQFQVGFRYAF
ncbi:porin [Vibrio casei]|uniref:Porin n=1 Tax=Vibrio casei TaxID=673372 RepID=A0A368LLR7_9VIBR|nr:porin [Vibrio casei]RCS72726.1 porin [Vibrio casei]SJN39562.1 Outer membrane protein OmpU [Vibrio casei]